MSSLCYGSETWGGGPTKHLDKVYKMGLKTALSIRFSTCDEIVYLETGTFPTRGMIQKRQIQFYSSLIRKLDVSSPLFKLIQKAKSVNLPYITYYEQLSSEYVSAEQCCSIANSNYVSSATRKIKDANNDDPNSRLGTYLEVNPDLVTPVYKESMFELERIHITRFRTGSHNLFIETGRFSSPRVNRDMRLCKCGRGIQTLHHVLKECDIVLHDVENIDYFENNFSNVSEYFCWNRLHEYLICVSKSLKIEL